MIKRLRILKGKVERKAKSIFSKYVPYNIKYKPKKIISLSSYESAEGIEYIQIRPPYVSELQMPAEFIERCSDYMKPMMRSENPGDYIVKIKDGRMLQDNGRNMVMMSSNGNLIDEISFQWKDDNLLSARENIYFTPRGFSKPKKIKGKVFSLLAGGGAITYYFHWILDSMPRVGLLKEM